MAGPTRAMVRKQLAAMISNAVQNTGVSDRAVEAGFARNYSPLGARLDWGSDPALGAALPRDPNVYLSLMGPGLPNVPSPLDRGVDDGRAQPRITQFPLNYNLPTAPDTYKLVPFKLMRRLVDQYDIAGICVNVRKQEIADVDWEIAPREEEKGAFKKIPGQKAGLFDQYRSQRLALTEFWKMPDRIRQLNYDSWMKMLIEEVLVTDSLSIFEHPTIGAAGGVLGTDLAALEIIDGTTIKPLYDFRGAPPQPPEPAYQQFIWGLPRVEMIALLLDAQVDPEIQALQRGLPPGGEAIEFRGDQLAYMPYNQRVWTRFGFSKIEQVIANINIALNRQAWHNARFTDGDIPPLLIHVPETWNLEQIQKYREMWHGRLAGQTSWHRVEVIPGAMAATELKPPVHQMDFDDFLMRITCAGMDMDPTEINMAPKSGLGGSGYMAGTADLNQRKTVKPLLRWVKTYMDSVIGRRLHVPELEFRFEGVELEDEAEQHKIDVERMSHATLTPNEYRERRGEPRIDHANADKYWFILGREVVPLDVADQAAAIAIENPTQGALDSTASAKPKPGAAGAGTAAAQANKSIDSEIDTFERFLSKPRQRMFKSDILPRAGIAKVYRTLTEGGDRKAAIAELRKTVLEGRDVLAGEVADALVESVSSKKAGQLQ